MPGNSPEEEDRIQREWDNSDPIDRSQLGDTYHKILNGPASPEKEMILQQIRATLFKNGIAPPTPKQFIDPAYGWVSERFLKDTYQWVKDDFIEAMTDGKGYSEMVFYGGTRLGKSRLARLFIYYTIVFFHHLRDVQSYLNVGEDTLPKIFLLSFDFDKVKEVYLDPIYELMKNSEKFHQVTRQDNVPEMQYKLGQEIIVYSKAATTGHLTVNSPIRIMTGNKDVMGFIGSDMLQCYISEIGYFIEHAGATEEDIFQLYSKSISRIKQTFGHGSYMAYTFLDTSANDAESKIENHILNKLQHKKDVMFRRRSQWEVPELVLKTFKKELCGENFWVCTGNGENPPGIIRGGYHSEAFLKVPEDLRQPVPIEYFDDFERSPQTAIKDIGGWPTWLEGKFINNPVLITRLFDEPSIWNPIAGIQINAGGDHNLWNKYRSILFLEVENGKLLTRRAIGEPRYFGIDIAFSSKGDIFGLTILHKEYSRTMNCVVLVCDMTIPFTPGKQGIDLEAPLEFLIALKERGGMILKEGGVDSFESQNYVQKLERHGIILTKHTSKDLPMHETVLRYLLSGTIKAGPNIFLRNNLKSLYRKKDDKKRDYIDHNKGSSSIDYSGNWDTSDCGLYHNDVYDSLAQAVRLADIDSKVLPMAIYEDECKRSINYVLGEVTPHIGGNQIRATEVLKGLINIPYREPNTLAKIMKENMERRGIKNHGDSTIKKSPGGMTSGLKSFISR